MYYRSMSLEPNGKVWVGTSEGVVMNTPGEPIKVSTPMVTAVGLNSKTTDLSVLSENLPFESDVEIKFQSLTHPREGVNYSYLIEGGISSWVELGAQDSLYLQDLDRGDYSIKLKAEHINGLKESEWLNIEFSVNEVWYKTTWALFSFLGTGVLLAVMGSKRKKRPWQRRRRNNMSKIG